MKYLLILLLVLAVAGCSSIGPVYDFFAHRHALPMMGNEVLTIPQENPKQQRVYNAVYQDAADQSLDALERHRHVIHSPGISAAVAIDGEVVWAGASGWADIKNRVALTTNSQFRIGSTSKALNATLLARLVDAKIINIDTPIEQYEIGRLNQDWASITPRQLSSHMAGIPHYNQNNDYQGLLKTMTLNTHYDNVADSVLIFDSSDTLFTPGEEFEYSSLGTVLLSAVMQEAAGQSYQTAMHNLVLAPLGMQSTQPGPPLELRVSQTPDLAKFYWHPDFTENKVSEWRQVDLSHRLAGGGYISTSTDLVKLGIGFNNHDFIQANTRDQFWTVQTLNSGETNEQGYAIGWRVRNTDFGEGIGTLFQANHGGVSRGAQSWLMVLPELNMAVAVNINGKTDEFWDFAKVSYELVKLFISQRSVLQTRG